MPDSSPPAADDRSLADLQLAKPTKRRRLPGGLVFLLVIGALAAGGVAFGQLTAVPTVTTAKVLRGSPIADREITTANGYVVARTRASVASKVQGRLVQVLVDEGDVVEVNQLLAEVDHDELDAQVAEAEANLMAAKELVPSREASLREAEAAVKTAEASLGERSAGVAEAEAVYKESQASFERVEYLFEKKIQGDADLDLARQARDVAFAREQLAKTALITAESQVVRAKATVEVARQQLNTARHQITASESVLIRVRATRDQAFIRAPFAGMVLRRDAEPGEVVSPANTGASGSKTAVVTLADFATLEIEVDVYERDIARIAKDTACRIVLDAYPDDPLRGRVRLLRPTADRARATINVYVEFAAVPAFARPEMGARVTFYSAAGEGEVPLDVLVPDELTVPAAAVTTRDGAEGVFVLVGKTLQFQPVRLGGERGDQRVLLEGPVAGADVVLDPAAELVDGAEVQVES